MPRSLTLTATRTVLKNAEALGAKVPKATAADWDALLTIIDRADALKAELSHDIGTKVVAALEAGADPFEDAAVQQAAVRTVLTDRMAAVEQAIDARTDRYMDDHAENLLAIFAGPFDRAAAKITDALGRLGDVDLTDTKAVAKRGPDAAAAWAEVQQAEQAITTITQTWKVLSGVTNAVPRIDKRYPVLVIAEAPAEEFVAERLGGVAISPWDAARRGWTLSLATPAGYLERIATINAEVARLDAARDRAGADAMRTRYGMAKV